MKQLIFSISLIVTSFVGMSQQKQTNPTYERRAVTAANMPEGTYLQKGKVMIKSGYKGVYDAGTKTMAIRKSNGGATTGLSGGFSCTCGVIIYSVNDCAASVSNNTLTCKSADGNCSSCILVIVVKSGATVAQ